MAKIIDFPERDSNHPRSLARKAIDDYRGELGGGIRQHSYKREHVWTEVELRYFKIAVSIIIILLIYGLCEWSIRQ